MKLSLCTPIHTKPKHICCIKKCSLTISIRFHLLLVFTCITLDCGKHMKSELRLLPQIIDAQFMCWFRNVQKYQCNWNVCLNILFFYLALCCCCCCCCLSQGVNLEANEYGSLIWVVLNRFRCTSEHRTVQGFWWHKTTFHCVGVLVCSFAFKNVRDLDKYACICDIRVNIFVIFFLIQKRNEKPTNNTLYIAV